MTPGVAVDIHQLADGDPGTQGSHANQSVGGAGRGADVHAGGAVDHGAAHAIGGAGAGADAAAAAGGGDIVQVDPALVDEAPGHAVHGFLPQNDHGGAGSQSCNLAVQGAGPGADVQAHRAADNRRGTSGDVGAGLLGLAQPHIVHADPALVDAAPGSAVHSGLLIDRDGSAVCQPGGQVVVHAGGGTDIDHGRNNDGAGDAGARVGAGAGAGGFIHVVGVGQEDPALGAVAPFQGGIQHGDGALVAPAQSADLGGLHIGILADVHIVIGDGDGDGGDDNGHLAQVVAQLDPAAGGELEPFLAAQAGLGDDGDGGIPLQNVDLDGIIGLLDNGHLGIVGHTVGLVDHIGGQGVVGADLVIGGQLPAGSEHLAIGGGAHAGDHGAAGVPAQELDGAKGRVIAGLGHIDGGHGAAHIGLNHLLGAVGELGIHTGIEHGKAQGAGIGGAVGAVQIQVCHSQTAVEDAPVGSIIGKACGIIIPGAHGIHKSGAGGIAVDGGHKSRSRNRPGGAFHIGVPHQGIHPSLHQIDGDDGGDNADDLLQLLTQKLVSVGLGDGGTRHTGGTVADTPVVLGHLIGVLMEAHILLDYPYTSLTDRDAGCRSRDGCRRNQTDQHHKRQQQASNSLFHRNLLLYSNVSYWYYNSISYKLQPLMWILFTICNFCFFTTKAPHFWNQMGAFIVYWLRNRNILLSKPEL